MTKTAQQIFAKGKALALDSLFVGEHAPFGYLAVGYVNETENGFEDPINNSALNSSTNYGGFKELEPSQYSYKRVQLQLVDSADYSNITYNLDTGKVTRTYQATLPAQNIDGTNINQIAIVSSGTNEESPTDIYSATTFKTFYKNKQSSITFRISFTL